MHTQNLRLRDDIYLGLVHRDRSPFGSALSGLIDRLVRHACRPALAAARGLDRDGLLREAPALLEPCFGSAALGQLYLRPGQLREECLYPALGTVTPAHLSVDLPELEGARSCSVDAQLWPELARWLDSWRRGARAPRFAPAHALWSRFAELGALVPAMPSRARARKALPELTFVGHASVALREGETTLVFDPFFVPVGETTSDYAPLSPEALDADAVFITHSHPDHYDFSSLSQLGSETPIFVPAVSRESLLSVDMYTRLCALGFSRVRAVSPGELIEVGPWQVRAERLCGEQPSDREVFHPETPNLGLIYLAMAKGGGPRVALLADAGPDHAGDCLDLAARMRARYGPIDALVSGFRAWHLNPMQFLSSSVPRYLLFVPPEQWGQRYSIMNGAEEVVEIAEAWGASTVIPYANGGAPWFWQRGLGPRLDDGDGEHDFDPGLGPLRRAVAQAQARGASFDLLALHPGEGARFDAGSRSFAAPEMLADGAWPFAKGYGSERGPQEARR